MRPWALMWVPGLAEKSLDNPGTSMITKNPTLIVPISYEMSHNAAPQRQR